MPENLLKMISAKAKPSTYYVLNWVENSNKNSKVKYVVKGMGSAVAIKEDMLATACHVVTNVELDSDGYIISEEFSLISVLQVNDDPKDPDKLDKRVKISWTRFFH